MGRHMTTSEGSLSPSTDQGVDLALVVAIQFVVAVAIWGAVGLALDQFLPIAPWGHFTGVMVGVAIGLVLAQRRAVAPHGDGGHGG